MEIVWNHWNFLLEKWPEKIGSDVGRIAWSVAAQCISNNHHSLMYSGALAIKHKLCRPEKNMPTSLNEGNAHPKRTEFPSCSPMWDIDDVSDINFQETPNTKCFTSWWLNQPIWKICSSNWIISPGRGENKKYLKPPPSSTIWTLRSKRMLKPFGTHKKHPESVVHIDTKLDKHPGYLTVAIRRCLQRVQRPSDLT